MDITQITTIIGAVASLLCTLVVGALAYFVKKTLSNLEGADKKNAERIDKVEAKQADALKALEDKQATGMKELSGELSSLKSDLPLVFTLREDFIRSIENIGRNMNGFDQKLDKLLAAAITQKE